MYCLSKIRICSQKYSGDGKPLSSSLKRCLCVKKGDTLMRIETIISEQNAIEKLTTYNDGAYVAFIKVSTDTSSGLGVRMLNMNARIDQIQSEDLETVFKKWCKTLLFRRKSFLTRHLQSYILMRLIHSGLLHT